MTAFTNKAKTSF